MVDKAFDDKKLSKNEILEAKDPTTAADLLAQKLIVGSLQKTFPKLLIKGEEGNLQVF